MARTPEGIERRKAAAREYRKARYAANREEFRVKYVERRDAETPERREARLAYARDYYAANRDRLRQAAEERRDAGYFREWRARQAATNPAYLPRQRLLRTAYKYGITPDRYVEMLEAQGGVCAICGQPETMTIGTTVCALAVDHDRACCAGKRSCGKCVRGLLCVRCNMALGGIKESVETLRAMAAYLEMHRAS